MFPRRWALLWGAACIAVLQLVGTPATRAQLKRPPATSSPASPTAFKRAATIERSIAIWRWFNRASPDSDAYYRGYISDAELRQIREWGFTAVRLSIGTTFLFQDAKTYGEPRAERLAMYDDAIRRINAAGLAVIVDYHPRNDIKRGLERDPEMIRRTVSFWRRFAQHLSSTDPDKVMLELLNEPRFENTPDEWNDLAASLVVAAREGAPRHTLILTAPYYGSIDRLETLRPVSDPNVIYTVHMYEPITFTAQGTPHRAGLSGLPWPSTTPACGMVADKIAEPDSAVDKMADMLKRQPGPRERALDYCNGGWDEARLRAYVAKAGAWQRTHKVPLWVGEFGVRAQDVTRADRRRWLQTAAAAFAAEKLPWSLWSYDDCFGLSMKRQCQTTLEPPQDQMAFACETLTAIGMGEKECRSSPLRAPAAAAQVDRGSRH